MLSRFLPPAVLAPLAFLLLITTPVIGFLCLVPFAVLKALAPVHSWRLAMGRATVGGAQAWPVLNRLVFRAFYPMKWRTRFPDGLSEEKSYLLICNHQSWIDILLVADLLYGRAPFPRFFLKRELLWVPVIGQGCWALDMPFMHRHSKEDIRRNPALKGKDLETTRKFCERYREIPVTVVNFVEGTRFTPAKQKSSPFRHLLRPKSAGVRVALESMGDQFDGILDVTIAYRPCGPRIVWSFLRGEQDDLAVHAELLPVPKNLLSAEGDEAVFRASFQNWINQRWSAKEALLEELKGGRPQPA